MKKLAVVMVATAVAIVASADIVDFKWNGTSGSFTTDDFVNTLLGVDLSTSVVGGEIALSELQAVVPYDSQAAVVPPFPFPYSWSTLQIQETDGGVAGQTAYAVVSGTDWASIGAGDTIFLAELSYVVPDLDNSPNPPSPGVTFDPGGVTAVNVVPEPATLGLMGIAGLGMYLARRKTRS
jgi:hypothetical protein